MINIFQFETLPVHDSGRFVGFGGVGGAAEELGTEEPCSIQCRSSSTRPGIAVSAFVFAMTDTVEKLRCALHGFVRDGKAGHFCTGKSHDEPAGDRKVPGLIRPISPSATLVLSLADKVDSGLSFGAQGRILGHAIGFDYGERCDSVVIHGIVPRFGASEVPGCPVLLSDQPLDSPLYGVLIFTFLIVDFSPAIKGE